LNNISQNKNKNQLIHSLPSLDFSAFYKEITFIVPEVFLCFYVEGAFFQKIK